MSVNLNFPNIVGTDTSDATATASDIAVGKTAYVNDVKITGTKEDVVQYVELMADISDISGTVSGSGRCGLGDMIRTFIIPDGTTKIPDQAFEGCRNLESVTIPNSVTSMGANAFNGCTNLAHIYFKGTQTQWSNLLLTTNSYWNYSMGSNVSGGTVIHYNS